MLKLPFISKDKPNINHELENKNYIISSDVVVKEGVRNIFNHKLNLNGDPRLYKIVHEMQASIERNQWKFPQNEAEFTKEMVDKIHNVYGHFDKHVIGFTKQLHHVKPGSAAWGKLYDKEVAYENKRVHENLKDYPRGTFACMEYAATASYVMNRCGLPNDLCGDYNSQTNMRHIFVQSRDSGAIIEATSRLSYCPVKDNQRLRDVRTVTLCAKNEIRSTYGNPEAELHVIDGSYELAQSKQNHKEKMLAEQHHNYQHHPAIQTLAASLAPTHHQASQHPAHLTVQLSAQTNIATR